MCVLRESIFNLHVLLLSPRCDVYVSIETSILYDMYL